MVSQAGQFILSDGTPMEVKYAVPPETTSKPLLVFIHGSFHSAWCWEKYFFPYFSSNGFPCVALSLRGTNGTFAGDGVKKVKIDDQVEDIIYFLECLNDGCDITKEIAPKPLLAPPVLIAHSFGGLAAMKILEHEKLSKKKLLLSMALLNSVPPSGITTMSLRALRSNPMKGWHIMQGLAMKQAVSNPKICRLLFFDSDEADAKDDAVLKEYMVHFQEDSKVTMDLRDMAKKLPMYSADEDGFSVHLRKGLLQRPALVLGGSSDFIVDKSAVQETARFFGVDGVIMDNAVHDVMLAKCRESVAERIKVWLDESST
jgi:pimeloyl-ACP methyl ester carboxylesterase